MVRAKWAVLHRLDNQKSATSLGDRSSQRTKAHQSHGEKNYCSKDEKWASSASEPVTVSFEPFETPEDLLGTDHVALVKIALPKATDGLDS